MDFFEFSGPHSFANIMKFNFCLEFKLFIAWRKVSFGVLHRPCFLGHKWAGREQSLSVIRKTVVTCRLSWTHSFHKWYFREGIILLKLEVLDDWKNSGRLDWKQPLIFQTLSEFWFFESHILLEISGTQLTSGECLLALKWLKVWLSVLTNQISLS